MTVTADDGHAGLCVAKFGPDDMHDPLMGVVEVVQADAKLLAVGSQRVDLLLGDRVCDGQVAIGSGHIMVRCGNGSTGLANFSTGEPEAFEGLGAGYFMNELKVDIEDGLLVGFGENDVLVPDFLKHGSWRTNLAAHFEIPAGLLGVDSKGSDAFEG